MTKHGIWRHCPFKIYRSERLFVDMTFEQDFVRLDKKLIAKTLKAIMQFGSFKSLELFGIDSQIEINAQQLPEHQIEDVHHSPGDFRNQNQHFHRHKNKMNFYTKSKKAKNVASSRNGCRKFVILSV